MDKGEPGSDHLMFPSLMLIALRSLLLKSEDAIR